MTSVSWVPAHPTTGENITATAHGYIKEEVTGGSFWMLLDLNKIPLFKHKGPICGYTHFDLPMGMGQVWANGLHCPAKPGPIKAVESVTIANAAPSGDITARFSFDDQNGNEIACVILYVKT